MHTSKNKYYFFSRVRTTCIYLSLCQLSFFVFCSRILWSNHYKSLYLYFRPNRNIYILFIFNYTLFFKLLFHKTDCVILLNKVSCYFNYYIFNMLILWLEKSKHFILFKKFKKKYLLLINCHIYWVTIHWNKK